MLFDRAGSDSSDELEPLASWDELRDPSGGGPAAAGPLQAEARPPLRAAIVRTQRAWSRTHGSDRCSASSVSSQLG